MTTYSKFNFVYRLQKWMDSVPGQTFLNYAYSWGASIVILGTLFKLTHLPGANFFRSSSFSWAWVRRCLYSLYQLSTVRLIKRQTVWNWIPT